MMAPVIEIAKFSRTGARGTCSDEPGARILVKVIGAEVYDFDIPQAQGMWHITWPQELGDGNYTLRVRFAKVSATDTDALTVRTQERDGDGVVGP